MNQTCPYCGGNGHVPIVTKGVKQRMFRAIWDNPGINLHRLERIAYNGRTALHPNTLRVHISNLRRLLEDTPFALVDGRSAGGYHIITKEAANVHHKLTT